MKWRERGLKHRDAQFERENSSDNKKQRLSKYSIGCTEKLPLSMLLTVNVQIVTFDIIRVFDWVTLCDNNEVFRRCCCRYWLKEDTRKQCTDETVDEDRGKEENEPATFTKVENRNYDGNE